MSSLKTSVGRVLRKNPYLYDKVRGMYGLVARKRYPLHAELSKLLSILPSSPNLIQLGASDGMTNDPYRVFIVEQGWNAVLVEPIPESFVRLNNNYSPYLSSGKLHLVNGAISYSGNTTARLYRYSSDYIKAAGEKRRMELLQKTSFDVSHLSKWDANLDPARDIETLEIAAYTVEKLSEKYFGGRCDVLAMDLEGYESVVLTEIDLTAITPKVIAFETDHISKEAWEGISRKFNRHDYQVKHYGSDALAILSA